MVAKGSGDGSIRHRADGRFEVRVRDAATGIRVARYATTEREARKMLRAMLGRVDRGVAAADASATVRGYAEVWLAERAGRRRTESTVREYRRRLNKYVLPRIGGLKLSALTMLDVEDALDELVESGLSASTVRGSRIALAAMLTDAVRARHLAVNVAALARLPEMDRSARAEVPTSVQVLDLLDAAIWFDVMVELLTVLVTTGVRVGEALGAYWSDLDLEAGVWEVQRTTTVNAAGVAVMGSRTETGEGRRVALHDAAVAAFTAQRARVAAARLAAGPLWSDHDLVFPSELGTVWDSRNARKRLRPITAAALFPGSFHALRHAFATTAVAVLPSDAAVAKVMGHRRKATTVDLYGHLRDVDFRSVTDAVAADLAAARPDPTLGVTLGVKSAAAARNPKHHRRSEA